MGDKIDVFIPLNQDTMDRHLRLLKAGACAIYDSEKVTPGQAADGVQLCPMPMKELTKGNKLAVNTAALGAALQLLGIESEPLESVVSRQFKKKGEEVVAGNIAVARAGYEYAAQNFKPFSWKAPVGAKPLGIVTGNQATAMGGAAAGVKFYAAYPMSPSTGVLMWMAQHARQLGIMVRQVEDEIGVMNMVIGAAHAGCRAMCATSGGGFALMTEAVGMAGHDRNAGRLRRCATRRTGHRRADQDRARRSLADSRRGAGRLPQAGRGADEPARFVPDDSGAV